MTLTVEHTPLAPPNVTVRRHSLIDPKKRRRDPQSSPAASD